MCRGGGEGVLPVRGDSGDGDGEGVPVHRGNGDSRDGNGVGVPVHRDGDGGGSQCMGTVGRGWGGAVRGSPPRPLRPTPTTEIRGHRGRSRTRATLRRWGRGGGEGAVGHKAPSVLLSLCPSVLPKALSDSGGRGGQRAAGGSVADPHVSPHPRVLLSPCPSVPLSSRRRFAPTSPPCSPYAAAAPPRQGALCFRPHLPEVIPSAPLDGAWDRNEPSGQGRRGGVIRVWVGVSFSGAASRQGEASQDVVEA